ncbi:PEP-CTERM sorting domain-containing protein [Geomonas edaphica]|uniref:PEP-CTERM sorting domain-containing protein n=1 Tax=Geomonas edaphica TaxID=2570226 RepID=UPI001FE62D6F|nr:PEP-CTERM sorting domain-containing protein [Geomonas edaphica]
MRALLRGLTCGLLLACSAATGWATTYDLGSANSDVMNAISGYTGNYATVTIEGNTVTFAGLQNVSFGGNIYDFMLNDVGMNVNGTATLSNFDPGTWAQAVAPHSPQQFDGFGIFNVSAGSTDSNGGNVATDMISFDSTNVALMNNLLGYNLAAHVYVFQEGVTTGAIATGFIANGAPPVPEPGTFLLLGTGFLGLAVFSKRRRNNA